MADRAGANQPIRSRGCLAGGTGAVVLAALAPFVLLVRVVRRWRRGSGIRTRISTEPFSGAKAADLCRIDFILDVPQPVEPGFRRRLTDSVVRVAEVLRASDDVYHLVYRLPWDEEPVTMPVGPMLQELGERFALVQSQGAMAGQTAVWLTLGRDRPLSEVVDPAAYDPESDGEPIGLLSHPELRWSMASEWAEVGPSVIFRLVVVVPALRADCVHNLLSAVG